MIIPKQVSYCNQKLIWNFGTFIREYFRLKPVSSTDNNIQTEKRLRWLNFHFLAISFLPFNSAEKWLTASRPLHCSQVFVWRPIAFFSLFVSLLLYLSFCMPLSWSLSKQSDQVMINHKYFISKFWQAFVWDRVFPLPLASFCAKLTFYGKECAPGWRHLSAVLACKYSDIKPAAGFNMAFGKGRLT